VLRSGRKHSNFDRFLNRVNNSGYIVDLAVARSKIDWLKNLNRIAVLYGNDRGGMTVMGLDYTEIDAMVKSKLRQSGLTVLDFEPGSEDPHIFIDLDLPTTVSENTKGYSNIEISLRFADKAKCWRNPSAPISKVNVFQLSLSKAVKAQAEPPTALLLLDKLVTDFCGLYRTANPRK